MSDAPIGDAHGEEERAHYMEVRFAFLEYSDYMRKKLRKMEDHIRKLPPTMRSALSQELTQRKFEGIQGAIARNQAFLDAVVAFQDRGSPFPLDEIDTKPSKHSRTTSRQVDKVSSTLRQLVRDWSAEGHQEREQSFGLVLGELQKRLPVSNTEEQPVKVLVPGAGLGRLALEMVARGYSTQGNEFSYFMLMVSNFMLNGAGQAHCLSVSPFIDTPCNTFSVEDMYRTITVPDVSSSSLLQHSGDHVDFSMTAGEWLEVYRDQDVTVHLADRLSW